MICNFTEKAYQVAIKRLKYKESLGITKIIESFPPKAKTGSIVSKVYAVFKLQA